MIENILIADDSATARMFIKRCFEMSGYQEATFYEAKDGYEALELVKSNPVDLVVTDLNMPHMDGKSLLKRLKTQPKLVHIPVLVITSADNPVIKEELMKFGALAILGKPVSPELLIGALEELTDDEAWGN